MSSVPSSPLLGLRRRAYRFSLTGALQWPLDAEDESVATEGLATGGGRRHSHFYSNLVRILDIAERSDERSERLEELRGAKTDERRESDELLAPEGCASRLDSAARSIEAFRQRHALQRQVGHMTRAAARRHKRHIDGLLSAQKRQRRLARARQRSEATERLCAVRSAVEAETRWLEEESEARGLNRRMERQARLEARRLRRQCAATSALNGSASGDSGELRQPHASSAAWLRRCVEERASSMEAAAATLALSRATHARTVALALATAPTLAAATASEAAAYTPRQQLHTRAMQPRGGARQPLFDRRLVVHSWQRDTEPRRPPREPQPQGERQEGRTQPARDIAGQAQRRGKGAVEGSGACRDTPPSAAAGGARAPRKAVAQKASTAMSRARLQRRARQPVDSKQQRQQPDRVESGHAERACPSEKGCEGALAAATQQLDSAAARRERVVQRLVQHALQCGDTSAATGQPVNEGCADKWEEGELGWERRRTESALASDGGSDASDRTTDAESAAFKQREPLSKPRGGAHTNKAARLVVDATDGDVRHADTRLAELDTPTSESRLRQPSVSRRVSEQSEGYCHSRSPTTSRFPQISTGAGPPAALCLSAAPQQPSLSPQLPALSCAGRSPLHGASVSREVPSRASAATESPPTVCLSASLQLQQQQQQQRSLLPPSAEPAMRAHSPFASAVSLSLWQQPRIPTRRTQAGAHFGYKRAGRSGSAIASRQGSVGTDPLLSAALVDARLQRLEAGHRQQHCAATAAHKSASALVAAMTAQREQRDDADALLSAAAGPRRRGSRRRSSVLMEEWKALEAEAEMRQWRATKTALHDRWAKVVDEWQQR